MDLDEFARQVNAIEQAQCAEKQAEGHLSPPLAAMYIPGMLRVYHDKGMTPEETHALLAVEAERERAVMRRCGHKF